MRNLITINHGLKDLPDAGDLLLVSRVDSQQLVMAPISVDNESEHEDALAYVCELMDAEPGSVEERLLVVLAALIELYEKDKI